MIFGDATAVGPRVYVDGTYCGRPLRFLAWKLELTEPQLARFAAVINELKTERAQAAVDDRRALTLLADASTGEAFDTARAGEAAKLRVDSAQRLQQRVAE